MVNKGFYFIQTFGCQMNEHDSEIMGGLLKEAGYERTERREDADVIILNTCCIREKAEHKVLSLLGELRSLADQKPHLVIGVSGCMVQQEDIVPKIIHACPHVNLLMGTYNTQKVAEYVDFIRSTGQRISEIPTEALVMEAALPAERSYSFKAFVNITFGCNNFCTYCIVPYVRGRERSRALHDIMKEVRDLVQEGVKEITFLGQNVNSYGNDLSDPAANFPELLRQADQVEGLQRIRFMTSHPKDLSDELISVIAESQHICHSVHLPVQAGSTRILTRMNRRYTRDDYLQLVSKMKNAIPDLALTTDIIVGFPGETEEDFQDTLSLAEAVGYDGAFSFIYSPRPGTVAEKFEDQVPLDIKKERLARLNKVLADSGYARNLPYQDQVVEVLVEGVSKTNADVMSGHTDTGKIVLFPGEPSLIGQLISVRITEPQTWVLKGIQI